MWNVSKAPKDFGSDPLPFDDLDEQLNSKLAIKNKNTALSDAPMTDTAYREGVVRVTSASILQNTPERALNYGVLGLANEAGEVAGEMKRMFRGDYNVESEDHYGLYQEISPDFYEKLLDELGDVEWYLEFTLMMLSTMTGNNITRADIRQRNAEKVLRRHKNGTIQGRGDR